MKSLRLTDNIRKGYLLTDIKTKIIKKELCKFNILQLDNILSEDECNNIIKNSAKIGFSESYNKDVRDADRLVCIDDKLNEILWNKIKDHIDIFKDIKPYGFNTAGFEWSPLRINECFRISKYTNGSKGFNPHFDAQYCKSNLERSVLSVVIYLNECKEGGLTRFYKSKNNKMPISGMTVNEEIKYNKDYETFDIKPVMGKCIIFPQTLLHAATNVKGCKYVLRTDIIYKRTNFITNPDNFTFKQKLLFNECMEYFREAQNREIDGNSNKAEEYFQRALSIRRLANSTFKREKIYVQQHWNIVMNFLSREELINLNCVNKTLNAFVQVYNSRFWKKIHKTFGNKKSDKEFIPKLVSRHGTICEFEYSNPKYVKNNLEGCIRVVAMYALAKFGHNINSDTFIANYDPESNTYKQVTLDYLLMCTFYNLPCNGKYYRYKKNSDSESESHFYEDGKCFSNESDDDHEVCDSDYYESDNKSDNIINVDEPDSSNYFILCDSTSHDIYYHKNFSSSKNNMSNKMIVTSYTVIRKYDGNEGVRYCHCSLGDTINEGFYNGEVYQSYTDNLIVDFSKQTFSIIKKEDYYIINLKQNVIKPFNHASCNCEIVIEYEKYIATHFSEIRGLSGIKITIKYTKNKVIMITKYDGVATF